VTAPPPRTKFHSPDDSVLLEDDSGRIKLVGEKLEEIHLVTGVIMAALGVETSTGEFRVVDLCFAEMAPNYRRWRALADGGKKEKRGATEVDGIGAFVHPIC
jgi:DNA polymerase delta subunit 2